MSEMVERVARAIATSLEVSPESWRDHEDEARAAIEAMREPTEGMVSAVRRAKPYDMDLTESWPIAIGEALK